MPKAGWREAIERWRSLPPEERRRLHMEAIPRHVANSMAMDGDEKVYNPFDILLLFQAGYITITEERSLGGNLFYRLGCPNRAARKRLDRALRHLTDR